MVRISVVVPIRDVEPYLAECLQSIARQTVTDLEVVMVDDGSTDASAEIAARFAAHDARFRLVRQPNGGLGAARNRGTVETSGEYLAFVDSDDRLPRDAYQQLLSVLESTGSDFASGGVRRLEGGHVVPARFLTETFARTRLSTHVRDFKPLLADRTAWNKLWRRSFWDAEDLRFPEGVWHEDIPVTIPAHFRARAVDVVSAPVYHWRQRDSERASITQRRLEPKVLHDRLSAVEHVHRFLVDDGPRGSADWYRRRLVRDDLRLHLDVLDRADEAYRAEFTERVNALLDGTSDRLCAGLPAIDRLKWHLVRRGRTDELLEVLRFQREAWPAVPVRRLGRWYGDYPFRGDRRLRVPRAVYRLGRADADLALEVQLERWQPDEAGRLRLHGRAAVAGLGSPRPDAQRLRAVAVPPGRWQRLLTRAGGVDVPSRATRRPELPARDAWSGFVVTLHPADLERAASRGRSELCISVRTRGIRRRRTRFAVSGPGVLRTHVVETQSGAFVEVTTGGDGSVRIRPRHSHARLRAYRLDQGDDAELMLTGDVRLPARTFPALEVRRASDDFAVAVPIWVDDARKTFRAWLSVGELEAAAASAERVAGGPETLEKWTLRMAHDGVHLPVEFPEELPRQVYSRGSLMLSLQAGPTGEAVIVETLAARVPAVVGPTAVQAAP